MVDSFELKFKELKLISNSLPPNFYYRDIIDILNGKTSDWHRETIKVRFSNVSVYLVGKDQISQIKTVQTKDTDVKFYLIWVKRNMLHCLGVKSLGNLNFTDVIKERKFILILCFSKETMN